jgi:hypothetical protein
MAALSPNPAKWPATPSVAISKACERTALLELAFLKSASIPTAMLLFNAIGVLCMLAPPFLAFFARKKFFGGQDINATKVSWRICLEWLALLSVSTLLVVCVVAFFTIPCDVARYGWGWVAKWRSFSAAVVRLTPVFLILAVFGRKGTRILLFCWTLAVSFDCLMVDMMA